MELAFMCDRLTHALALLAMGEPPTGRPAFWTRAAARKIPGYIVTGWTQNGEAATVVRQDGPDLDEEQFKGKLQALKDAHRCAPV